MSERQRDDKVTVLVASIMGNLASKTWLSGLSDIVGALSEPDQNAAKLVQRLAGSLAIPTGIAQVARVMDPVAREADTIGEYVQSRIPGVSDRLQPRLDMWGRPIVNEGGVGPDIISPIWQSTARNDPVNRELKRIDYAPGPPRREVGGRKLTPQEYTRYQMEAGKRAHAGLQPLVTSRQWQGMDSDAKQAAAEKVVKAARNEARAELFPGSVKAPRNPGILRKKSVPPPPKGFSMEGEAGGRNVYAELQRAIPGVQATSGFRSPEYQADMRRRGYNPAQNSGHLSGSSLDLLPPKGRTLGWLAEQVRRYDPNAHVINERDHLHVTFPGYYGAPVLGGAKGAGVRNPYAGMPPPPPGFKLQER